MSEFGDDILAEYVLGTLDGSELAGFEAALQASGELRRRTAEVRELLATVGHTLEPVEPPASLRDRLLESASRTNRFERFASRVAELIDVTLTKAKALLAGIDDPASWVPGFSDGIELYHLDGGPRIANAVVGFVKMKAGLSFPHHHHVGRETVLVLQGVSTDEDGGVARPGDEIVKEPGTEHTFATDAGAPDYIYLAIVEDGVRIGDDLIGPGDPRF